MEHTAQKVGHMKDRRGSRGLHSGTADTVGRGVGARRSNQKCCHSPFLIVIYQAQALSQTSQNTAQVRAVTRTMFRRQQQLESSQHARVAGERSLVRRLDIFLMTFGCISQSKSRRVRCMSR